MLLETTTASSPTFSPRLCYSIENAAKALDVSRATIYRLMKLGKLASVPILGKTVIERSAIDSFLAASRIQAPKQ